MFLSCLILPCRCIKLAQSKHSKQNKFTLAEDLQLLKGYHAFCGNIEVEGKDHESKDCWSKISMCFLCHRTPRECRFRWGALQRDWMRAQKCNQQQLSSSAAARKKAGTHYSGSNVLTKQGTKVDGSLVSSLLLFLRDISDNHTGFVPLNRANDQSQGTPAPPGGWSNIYGENTLLSNNSVPLTQLGPIAVMSSASGGYYQQATTVSMPSSSGSGSHVSGPFSAASPSGAASSSQGAGTGAGAGTESDGYDQYDHDDYNQQEDVTAVDHSTGHSMFDPVSTAVEGSESPEYIEEDELSDSSDEEQEEAPQEGGDGCESDHCPPQKQTENMVESGPQPQSLVADDQLPCQSQSQTQTQTQTQVSGLEMAVQYLQQSDSSFLKQTKVKRLLCQAQLPQYIDGHRAAEEGQQQVDGSDNTKEKEEQEETVTVTNSGTAATTIADADADADDSSCDAFASPVSSLAEDKDSDNANENDMAFSNVAFLMGELFGIHKVNDPLCDDYSMGGEGLADCDLSHVGATPTGGHGSDDRNCFNEVQNDATVVADEESEGDNDGHARGQKRKSGGVFSGKSVSFGTRGGNTESTENEGHGQPSKRSNCASVNSKSKSSSKPKKPKKMKKVNVSKLLKQLSSIHRDTPEATQQYCDIGLDYLPAPPQLPAPSRGVPLVVGDGLAVYTPGRTGGLTGGGSQRTQLNYSASGLEKTGENGPIAIPSTGAAVAAAAAAVVGNPSMHHPPLLAPVATRAALPSSLVKGFRPMGVDVRAPVIPNPNPNPAPTDIGGNLGKLFTPTTTPTSVIVNSGNGSGMGGKRPSSGGLFQSVMNGTSGTVVSLKTANSDNVLNQ